LRRRAIQIHIYFSLLYFALFYIMTVVYLLCLQPVSAGGSNAGRHTIRVLQSLLDHYAVMSSPIDSCGVLSDTVSSQQTPIRFASLLNVFRYLPYHLSLYLASYLAGHFMQNCVFHLLALFYFLHIFIMLKLKWIIV